MVEEKFNNSAPPEKKNGRSGGGLTKALKKGIKKVGSYNTLLKASQQDDDDDKKLVDSPKSAVATRLNASFGDDDCWSVGAYDDDDDNHTNDSINDNSFLMSPEGTADKPSLNKHQIIGGGPPISQVTKKNGSHKSLVSLLDEQPENEGQEEDSRIPPPPPPPQDYPESPHSITSSTKDNNISNKKKKNKKKSKDDLGASSHHNNSAGTYSEISINDTKTTTKKKKKIKKQNSKRNLLSEETNPENVDDCDASTKGKKKNKKPNSKRNLLRSLANEDEEGGKEEANDSPPTKPKRKKSEKRQSSKRNLLLAGEDTEIAQDSFASLNDGIAMESAAAGGKSQTKKKDKKPKKQKSKSKDDMNSTGHSTSSKNSASSVNEDFVSLYDEMEKKLEKQYDDMVQKLGYECVSTEEQEGRQSNDVDPTSLLGLTTVQSKAADTVAVAAVAGIQATQEEPQRQQPSEQPRQRKKSGKMKRRGSTGMLFNPADEDRSNDMGDPLAYISKDDTCGILEDSNQMNRKVSYLLGDVETLEKDLAKERATLQKIRETAAFERESLEIKLQLESDENEQLRERVRDLEYKASEKHFTSVANEEDAIRTVRSENEALKEQIRKLQEEVAQQHARERRSGLSTDRSFRSDDSGIGALSSTSVHSQPFKDDGDNNPPPLFCEDGNTSVRSSTDVTASFRFQQQGGLLQATAKIKDHEATIEKQARDLSEMEKQIRMYRTGSQVNEAIFQLKRAEGMRAEMEVKNKKLESTIADQNQLIQMLMTQVADAKRQYELLQLPKNPAPGGGRIFSHPFRRSNSLRGLFDSAETDNDTVDTSSRTSSGFGLSSRIRKSSSAAGLFNMQ